MKYFFSTVGFHNPLLATSLPEHMGYPVSQQSSNGLDLDYTGLLIGRGFTIDSTLYDYVISGEKEFLRPMADTLKELSRSGLLESVDMGGMIAKESDHIKSVIESLLNQPEYWLPEVRSQWVIVKSEFESFQRSYGSTALRVKNCGHFGVENWLYRIGEENNDYLREQAMRLLESKRLSKFTKADLECIKGIVEFIVAQVVVTDFLRYKLQKPFLNWDDSRPYYEKLYSTRWHAIDDHKEFEIRKQAHDFFDMIVPELKPQNVSKVIEFIQEDRAVESMREELFSMIDNGENVSQQWFNRYITEAFRKELNNQDRRRKFRWYGSAANVLLPGSGLLEEVVTEATMKASENSIGRPKRSFAWLYALQKRV